jgi:hypothetical protein
MGKEKENISDRDIKNMLHDFHVNSENELNTNLNDEWNKSFCTRCGKELDLLTCSFDDGDPICFGGFCHRFED